MNEKKSSAILMLTLEAFTSVVHASPRQQVQARSARTGDEIQPGMNFSTEKSNPRVVNHMVSQLSQRNNSEMLGKHYPTFSQHLQVDDQHLDPKLTLGNGPAGNADSTDSVCYNACHSECHSACHGDRSWR